MKKNNKNTLSLLPSVQLVIDALEKQDHFLKHEYLVKIVRNTIDQTRKSFIQKKISFTKRDEILNYIISNVLIRIQKISNPSMSKVINGTGIVLHTGLGRAPFGHEIMAYLQEQLSGYVNLEFDIPSGLRGERLDHTNELLKLITGAESSAIVNNNAAAVLIAINTLCEGKEIIVSRGELIEIGGSFRLPDVISKSGAKMVEVGTTNRTHLKDYANAISKNTGAILLAHPSNYRIQGFTTSPEHSDIIQLAKKSKIPVIMDLGSGALIDLKTTGLAYEETVQDNIRKKFDLITFSGDKLLGGPQAGIIVGNRTSVAKVRKNPLMRAMRCDKIIISTLNYILRKYLDDRDYPELQTYKLFSRPIKQLKFQAEEILSQLPETIIRNFSIKIIETKTEAGSGSLPVEDIPDICLRFSAEKINESFLAKKFRMNNPPIIGYCKDKQFFLSLKAIPNQESCFIIDGIQKIHDNLPDLIKE